MSKEEAIIQQAVINSWKRIDAWLLLNAPEVYQALRPGASEAQIREAEAAMGITFPEEVRASYAIHDGQVFGEASDPGGYGLFGSKEFFCLQRMVENWRFMKGLLDAGTFTHFQSFPDPQIEPGWWRPEWIPLTHDGSANNECLDMGPSALGTTGQIISFWHDMSEREIITNSYGEWLSNFANDLEAGEYIISDEYNGIVRYSDVYD